MELGFVESDREKPLVKIINNLGGWEVLRSFNLYSWDSHRVLKRLHADYYVNGEGGAADFLLKQILQCKLTRPS